MKHIIFGGSFDPIHLGHTKIAESALKKVNADFVHFVPAKKVSYKKMDENGVVRAKLIEIAIRKNNQFKLDEFELNNNDDISYTIDLVKHFKKLYPNDELYLLIGNDQLENFHQWKDYLEILRYVRLIVYQRDFKIDFEKGLKYNAIFLMDKNIDISSSLFKETFNKRLLDKDVFDFIIKRGLYYYYFLNKYESEKRLAHSVRVANMMKELFKKHDSSKQHLAYVAGLYHDLCKCMSQDQIELVAYDLMKLEKAPWKVLHGPVASYFLFNIYNFDYLEALNAITRHTKPYDYGTGELSDLDMALFCCDKLEPFRTNEDVENIEYYRDLLNKNIGQCFFELYEAVNKQYDKH